MKYKIVFFVLFLFLGIVANAQTPSKSCPRNFDSKALIALKKSAKKNTDSVVAFDAVVKRIEKGYSDRPYFEVGLDRETIWVASMMGSHSTHVGQKIRILGYIGKVQKDDEIGMLYNKKGIQVRAFAILDTATKQLNFSDAFEKEAKLWQSGNIPK